jgi:coronin-1B/1C/6
METGGFEPDSQAQCWRQVCTFHKSGYLADIHRRKVGQVVFHPTASNLLTSASGDHLVRLWDISTNNDSPVIQLKGHGDTIQSLSWNAVGTTLVTVGAFVCLFGPILIELQTCRDKKIRLFDPRTGVEAVRVADGHSGVKGSRVIFLGDRDRIVTTGVSCSSFETSGNVADLTVV